LSLSACGADPAAETVATAGTAGAEPTTASAAPVDAPSETADAGTGAITADGCLLVNERGDLVWDGAMTSELQALADRLNEAVAAAPDQFTGTALCAHYEGVVVFVKEDSTEVSEQVAAIASAHSAFPVTVSAVGASLTDLEAAMRTAMELPGYAGMFSGAGPDPRTGGLVISVRMQDVEADPGEVVDAAALAAELGVPVRLTATGEGSRY
jgi:hypothetical protein